MPDDLQVLAELAMALAGFTGLIGVLHHRSGGKLTDRQRLHIATLLTCAVIVIIMSFVPTWLALLPGSEERIWPWSMRALLAAHLLAWIIAIPFNKLGKVIVESLPPVERYIGHAVNIIGVAAVAIEVAIVAGIGKEYGPFVYEGVLIFFLALGLANFLSLLLNPDQ